MKPCTIYDSPSGDSVATTFNDFEEELTLKYMGERGLLDMPLGQAAETLKVSAGSLKRTCRRLGLVRWPYRQRNSLRHLMASAAEYMDESVDEGAKSAIMETLQRELDDVRSISGRGITESTRRFRQTIFKLNHEAKKKNQRRKLKANGRRVILNQAKHSSTPMSPHTGFLSHETLAVTSGGLYQPERMDGDSIARHQQEDLLGTCTLPLPELLELKTELDEEVRYQRDVKKPEMPSTRFQPTAVALSPPTYAGSVVSRFQPGAVFQGRPLGDHSVHYLPGRVVGQGGFQNERAASNHQAFLDTYRSRPSYTNENLHAHGNSSLPGLNRPMKEAFYPTPTLPELRWLVQPRDDHHHRMKLHGAQINFLSEGTCNDQIPLVNPAANDDLACCIPDSGESHYCGNNVFDVSDSEIMNALDLL